jgi:hypothetical protein
MALRLSTGLRDALLEQKAQATNLMTAATISFGNGTGTAGRDQILDSGDGLGDFIVKGKITVAGAGEPGNNGTFDILSVADDIIEVPAGSLTTESDGAQVILAGATGGSISDIFRNCVVDIYSGSQPANADSAETGTKLARITVSSGAFVAGEPDNGLNFDEAASGVLSKDADEVWSGEGLADGTAGWFRMYDNAAVAGASTSEIRLDGSVATSGGQFNMSNTSITDGGTTTVDSASLTMPAS